MKIHDIIDDYSPNSYASVSVLEKQNLGWLVGSGGGERWSWNHKEFNKLTSSEIIDILEKYVVWDNMNTCYPHTKNLVEAIEELKTDLKS